MSWKKAALQIGLLAIDYGIKQQKKKKSKTRKNRKNIKKKG